MTTGTLMGFPSVIMKSLRCDAYEESRLLNATRSFKGVAAKLPQDDEIGTTAFVEKGETP
jgi:hypothetical protein